MKRGRRVDFYDVVFDGDKDRYKFVLMFKNYIINMLQNKEYNQIIKQIYEEEQLSINENARNAILFYYYEFDNEINIRNVSHLSDAMYDILIESTVWLHNFKDEHLPLIYPKTSYTNHIKYWIYMFWKPKQKCMSKLPKYCRKSIIYSIIILKKYRVPKDIIFIIIKMAINNWIDYSKVIKSK